MNKDLKKINDRKTHALQSLEDNNNYKELSLKT